MGKINLLDSKVYNRIAAGEVVERPASVVKELVENSIDAGADEITVEIEEGGIRLVKVSDNGCGIEEDDVKNAFLPHATSKLKNAEDLEKIQTLGFRGEALSSIASVSTVELKTKTDNATLATLIQLSGGDLDGTTRQSGNKGTSITIKRLFYNTPARAKFLKKPKSEESEVSALMVKLILANPDIRFHYMADGESVYRSNGKGLKEALYAVYSKEIVDNLVEVSYRNNGYGVYGFTGNLNLIKHNRNFQTIILNGRVITNSTVSSAAMNAYGESLMKKCYPIFVLNISVPNESVDVNVHPSKSEVRFSDNATVYSLVFHGIRNALFPENGERTLATEKEEDSSDKTIVDFFNAFKDLPQPEFKKKFNIPTQESNLFRSVERSLENNVISSIEAFDQAGKNSASSDNTSSPKCYNLWLKQDSFEEEQSNFKVVGQAFHTYLLIECENNLLILDQHAIHERTIYDKLMKKLENKEIVSQQIISEVVTLSHDDYAIVNEFIDPVKELGIEIEEFGPLSFKLSAVPDFLSDFNLDLFFSELCKQARQSKRIDVRSLLRDEIAKIACKSAIKGNTKLTDEQIKSVVFEFVKNKIPMQCPHGRPAIISLSKNDMEKLFKRKL